jgi:hypothetical protein
VVTRCNYPIAIIRSDFSLFRGNQTAAAAAAAAAIHQCRFMPARYADL